MEGARERRERWADEREWAKRADKRRGRGERDRREADERGEEWGRVEARVRVRWPGKRTLTRGGKTDGKEEWRVSCR